MQRDDTDLGPSTQTMAGKPAESLERTNGLGSAAILAARHRRWIDCASAVRAEAKVRGIGPADVSGRGGAGCPAAVELAVNPNHASEARSRGVSVGDHPHLVGHFALAANLVVARRDTHVAVFGMPQISGGSLGHGQGGHP